MSNVSNISTTGTRRPPDMGIDWEFQPSLQHLVVRTERAHAGTPTWAETMPASFDSFDEPATFREPLEGLAVRDIDEPEIFRAFFGEDAPASARRA
jgi:hypothetical protein